MAQTQHSNTAELPRITTSHVASEAVVDQQDELKDSSMLEPNTRKVRSRSNHTTVSEEDFNYDTPSRPLSISFNERPNSAERGRGFVPGTWNHGDKSTSPCPSRLRQYIRRASESTSVCTQDNAVKVKWWRKLWDKIKTPRQRNEPPSSAEGVIPRIARK
ncbi:hypothetical protein B0O99DRAFT_597242 [Bisporella sp. PMI_857]|nr:hypothetical protein B0O99DRAFT_597242 [Bisporella sp. PMI_857]